MSEPGGPGEARPDAAPLDQAALRRRVLLAGVVSLGAFFVLGYVLTALGAPPWLLLPSLVVVVVLLVRPLMVPVLAADRRRRRQAYAAFRHSRGTDRR